MLGESFNNSMHFYLCILGSEIVDFWFNMGIMRKLKKCPFEEMEIMAELNPLTQSFLENQSFVTHLVSDLTLTYETKTKTSSTKEVGRNATIFLHIYQLQSS